MVFCSYHIEVEIMKDIKIKICKLILLWKLSCDWIKLILVQLKKLLKCNIQYNNVNFSANKYNYLFQTN